MKIMWDTVETSTGSGTVHLSHDLPCSRCGHAVHTFLACSDTCDCVPSAMPGALPGTLLVG
jgi:hypothetical protein